MTKHHIPVIIVLTKLDEVSLCRAQLESAGLFEAHHLVLLSEPQEIDLYIDETEDQLLVVGCLWEDESATQDIVRRMRRPGLTTAQFAIFESLHGPYDLFIEKSYSSRFSENLVARIYDFIGCAAMKN